MHYKTKCGCIVVASPPNFEIKYCPLHKVALELYEALKRITTIEQSDVPYDKYDVLGAINIAKAAITKVEVKK